MKTIREVSVLADIAVSALRHYDDIGLLKPGARSPGGVRLYGREELLRLREILIWRQLGFALGDIARILDDPGYDRAESLRRQLKLAEEQLDRFRSISENVRTILSAVDVGRPLSEDAVFAGFAKETSSVSRPAEGRQTGKQDTPARPGPRIANFAFLGHRSEVGRARPRAVPPRIVATDPIRMAESVLALGILPVAAWTYPDRFDEAMAGRYRGEDWPGTWPWPPLIEPVVRKRIGDLGVYGGLDGQRVIEARPDLVLTWEAAMWKLPPKRPPTEAFKYKPYEKPGFRTWLPEIAACLGLPGRGEALLARWQARTAAFRPHLAGRSASMLNIWRDAESCLRYRVPTDGFESQIFTEVGLRVIDPSERLSPDGFGSLVLEPEDLGELEAPTLFFGTYHMGREAVADLLASPAMRQLPAVRNGRAIDLGWAGVRSGWFTSHWQLGRIARSYGLVQLRSEDPLDTVYAVADPASGVIGISPAFRDMTVTLSGPGDIRVSAELSKGQAGRMAVSPGIVSHLCGFPDSYQISTGQISVRNGSTRLASSLLHDRESALERVAVGLEAAALPRLSEKN
jgi:DNA-binding transcriptional MerR regulator/ABC-type Fe3+-hydroxamate transport system substrate-binding protein